MQSTDGLEEALHSHMPSVYRLRHARLCLLYSLDVDWHSFVVGRLSLSAQGSCDSCGTYFALYPLCASSIFGRETQNDKEIDLIECRGFGTI